MYIILFLTAFTAIILFEAPGLIYRKYWRELITFFFFLALAFGISIIPVLGYDLPSPARGIEIIVKLIQSLL